jgi:hypothetical protein
VNLTSDFRVNSVRNEGTALGIFLAEAMFIGANGLNRGCSISPLPSAKLRPVGSMAADWRRQTSTWLSACCKERLTQPRKQIVLHRAAAIDQAERPIERLLSP